MRKNTSAKSLCSSVGSIVCPASQDSIVPVKKEARVGWPINSTFLCGLIFPQGVSTLEGIELGLQMNWLNLDMGLNTGKLAYLTFLVCDLQLTAAFVPTYCFKD